MPVPMVGIGEMRMAVHHGLMPVRMAVPRARLHRRLVRMVMMRVARAMHMLM